MLLLAPIKGLLKKHKYTVGDYFKSFSLGISLVFLKNTITVVFENINLT